MSSGNLWSLNPSDWFGSSDNAWRPTFDQNQQPVSQQVSQYFQGLNPQSFNYTGQLTAPIGQGESDLVANNARLNAIAGNTFGQIGQYNPQDINDQFDKNVQNPTLSAWQNTIAPYVRAQAPAFSSDQARLVGESGQQLAAGLGQQRMSYQQQAQTNALNALSGANSYYQGAAGIQAIPREIQQAGLTNAYNNFLNSNQQYSGAVGQMLGYLGIQSQAYVQQPNPLQQLIGAAGAGAQIGSALSGNPAGALALSGNVLNNESQTPNYGTSSSPYSPNYNPNNPGNLTPGGY